MEMRSGRGGLAEGIVMWPEERSGHLKQRQSRAWRKTNGDSGLATAGWSG